MQQNRQTKTTPVYWIKGLEEGEKKKMVEVWQNSTYIFDRLKKIIEELKRDLPLDVQEDYKNPNWAYYRADKNGQLIAYNEILRLLP